ncbi:PLP-dependent aminotransferase family protein [Pseudonocardia zijingensis]|uniref:PLP-dependent aminotransferase family protein n=1 Tax=Pseudonocardia zijingensis TaxID=153376 RepID=A0ABP4ACU4_9PSEU
MSLAGIERRIGAPSFARLLGDWRPPDGRGLAEALADRIRLLVLDGRLPLETRLPAERELAAALAVSRTTVAGAYEALRSAGVLRSRRGAGSWTRLPPAQANGTSPSPFSPLGGSPLYDLAHAALPAPRGPVRTAAAAAVHDLDALLAGHGYDLSGQPALRAAIADRYTARGLPTTPDQVLVTAGGVHGIHLALMVLAGPGDRVLVEHPTYPNAITAVTARGTRPVPVPMAPDGVGGSRWDLDLLTSAVRDAAPRLAYVIPDFQNPTGALLDGADRARLVDLARRTGTTLLVDETLADLALENPPELPVAAHGGAESPLVLSIGSASKTFWGGLRIGWIRTSAAMVRRLAAARAGVDLGGPVLEQLVVARLLAHHEEITTAVRSDLLAARDHLLDRIARTFPGWRPSRPGGGLSLWVDLGRAESSRLAGAARRRDVLLAAGPRFGLDGAFERYLRLPFTLPQERMDEALDRLAGAWADLDRPGGGVDGDPVAVA